VSVDHRAALANYLAEKLTGKQRTIPVLSAVVGVTPQDDPSATVTLTVTTTDGQRIVATFGDNPEADA